MRAHVPPRSPASSGGRAPRTAAIIDSAPHVQVRSRVCFSGRWSGWMDGFWRSPAAQGVHQVDILGPSWSRIPRRPIRGGDAVDVPVWVITAYFGSLMLQALMNRGLNRRSPPRRSSREERGSGVAWWFVFDSSASDLRARRGWRERSHPR